jgi:hypothetical protein
MSDAVQRRADGAPRRRVCARPGSSPLHTGASALVVTAPSIAGRALLDHVGLIWPCMYDSRHLARDLPHRSAYFGVVLRIARAVTDTTEVIADAAEAATDAAEAATGAAEAATGAAEAATGAAEAATDAARSSLLTPCLVSPLRSRRYRRRRSRYRRSLAPLPAQLTPLPKRLARPSLTTASSPHAARFVTRATRSSLLTPRLIARRRALVTPHRALVTPRRMLVTPDAHAVTPHRRLITPRRALATPHRATVNPDARARHSRQIRHFSSHVCHSCCQPMAARPNLTGHGRGTHAEALGRAVNMREPR